MSTLETKTNRAQELIETSKHISLATSHADGSPHNSPVRFFYDEKLENIYRSSSAEALHSQNILRTGQVFAVLFSSLTIEVSFDHDKGGEKDVFWWNFVPEP